MSRERLQHEAHAIYRDARRLDRPAAALLVVAGNERLDGDEAGLREVGADAPAHAGIAHEVAPSDQRRVVHLAQAAGAHLEARDRADDAEAVLRRAKEAGVVFVPAEIEHGVHRMLEGLRPGHLAFLVDLRDQNN